MNKIFSKVKRVIHVYYFIINGLFYFNFYPQFELNEHVKVKFKILTERSENVIWTFCRTNGEYYFIFQDDFIKGKKINFYINSVNKTKKVTIPCPEEILKLKEGFIGNIYDIAYNEHLKILSILGFNGLIWIDLADNNKVHLMRDGIKNFNEIYPFGKESFLLIRNYNYHDSDEKIKTFLKAINFKKNKTLERHIDFNHDIVYTMLVDKFFDVHDNKIVYCRTTEPKFYILDSNLKTIDSSYINYDNFISNKKITDKKEYSFAYKTPKEIYFLLKSLDSVNSRIEKIFFNNDTTIILTIKNPGTTFMNRSLVIFNLKTKQIIDKLFWTQHEIYSHSRHFLHFASSLKMIIKNFHIYSFSYLPSCSYTEMIMEDLKENLSSKRKNKYAFVSYRLNYESGN